jgi:diaminobutyrate acetyltransferase
MQKTIYRHPHFEDGLSVYHLIKSCPPLDVNSIYYYYVLCRDFANTSVIAEQDKKIVGFLSAYLKPQAPECLFVWQVAVAESARGQKIASNMLNWLSNQAACSKVNTLETTIYPSNQASQSLFKRFAEHHQASCHTSTFLDISQFGKQAHEAEILFRIQWMR